MDRLPGVPPAPNELTCTSSTDRAKCFGAHLSVAGGLDNACLAARKLRCACVQIFVKNQRQWRAPPLTTDQIDRFRAAVRDTGVARVVAHASYLINLAAPDDIVRGAGERALRDELERCEHLGIESLVVHPGAHRDDSPSVGMKRIASAINRINRVTRGFQVCLLLETTAGQGTSLGWRFEQIATILDRITDSERVGVCLDTCHLFAAGHDFRSVEKYEEMIDQLDRVFGAVRVRCIHMNDSKHGCGSRRDRHEHIGKGRIGRAGFIHFVNDPRFSGIPMILETPKGADGRGVDYDRLNLRRLRSFIRRSGSNPSRD